MEKVKKIEISHRTIVFSVLFLVAIWFLYQIREILLALFISIILMGAINPTVDRLERWRLPRWLAILLIYLVLLSLIITAIAGLIPPLVDQTSRLVQVVIDLSDRLSFLGLSSEKIRLQIQELGALPTQILKLAVSIFSNIIAIFAILVITFYLLLEHKNLDRYLFFLFGQKRRERAKRVVGKLEKKLGGWVRAELLLMTIIGLLSYIGFRLLDLQFALPLAILAGLLEVVPNIGPTLSAVPAVAIGLLESSLIGLLVLAWTFIIQQLENNLIVPKLMQKTVGVNPLITILTLAVGFKLAGVMGAVLAIPVYLAIEVVVSEFISLKKAKGQ